MRSAGWLSGPARFLTRALGAPLVVAVGVVLVWGGPASGRALAATRTSSGGMVAVVVSTPAGVAVNTRLIEDGRARVLAKAAAGKAKVFRVRFPAGQVRMAAPNVIAKGKLYVARVSHERFHLRRGGHVVVRVTYRAVPVAVGLNALSITGSSVTLGWTAPRGTSLRLRRAVGTVAPRSVSSGQAVPIRHGHAVDQRLNSRTEYSYALFTRVRGRWEPPVTASVGTAAPGTAAYVAPPSTIIVRQGDPYVVRVVNGRINVVLPAGAPTPVLGAAVVLPISTTLPGGFLGKVSAVSANGRSVQLAPAGLTDAFTAYRLNTSFSGAAAPLGPAPHAAHPRSGSCDVGGSFGGQVDLRPSISLSGSFTASLLEKQLLFVSIPVGAKFSLDLSPTFAISPIISTTGQVDCSLPLDRYIDIITEDPVPISIVFDPEVSASVGGKVSVSGISASTTFGLRVNAQLGLEGNYFNVNPTENGTVQGESATEISAPIEGSVGGQLTFGPGAGSSGVGAIAGISGSLDPVKVGFDPSIDSAGKDACLTTTLGGDASLGLNASVWVDSLSAQESWNVLTKSWDYISPIKEPSGCGSDGGGGGGGGGSDGSGGGSGGSGGGSGGSGGSSGGSGSGGSGGSNPTPPPGPSPVPTPPIPAPTPPAAPPGDCSPDGHGMEVLADGQGGLYVADQDGSCTTKIASSTNQPGNVPAFTTDNSGDVLIADSSGQNIYRSFDGGPPELMLANVCPQGGTLSALAFTADVHQGAWVCATAGWTDTIEYWNGAGIQELYTDTYFHVDSLAITPDGKELVYDAVDGLKCAPDPYEAGVCDYYHTNELFKIYGVAGEGLQTPTVLDSGEHAAECATDSTQCLVWDAGLAITDSGQGVAYDNASATDGGFDEQEQMWEVTLSGAGASELAGSYTDPWEVSTGGFPYDGTIDGNLYLCYDWGNYAEHVCNPDGTVAFTPTIPAGDKLVGYEQAGGGQLPGGDDSAGFDVVGQPPAAD